MKDQVAYNSSFHANYVILNNNAIINHLRNDFHHKKKTLAPKEPDYLF